MSAKTHPTPKLVIIEGKDKGKVIPLKDGTAVIGRSKGDVVVQDPRVSRSHVAVHYSGATGKLSFTDLKSLNGTFVNGQTAESGELHDGDKLQLGNTLFDCQISDDTHIAPRTAAVEISENLESNVLGEAPPPSSSKQEPSWAEPAAQMSETSEPKSRDEFTDNGILAKKRKRTLVSRVSSSLFSLENRRKTMAFAILVGCTTYLLMPDSPNSRVSLASQMTEVSALINSGQLPEALEKTDALMRQHSSRSEPYFLMGEVQAKQGKLQPAVLNYQKAHDLKPDLPLISVRLIPLYLKLGMAQEAQRELAQLDNYFQEGKHSKELFIEAAQLFLDHRELKQAPEKTLVLAKALQTEFAPESAVGYKLEAQLLFQLSKNEQAHAVLEKAIHVVPNDEWMLEHLAFAKLSLKDIPGAMAVVQSWLEARPESAKPLLVMAYLKYNERKFAEARPFVEKIIQLAMAHPTEPMLPEALNLMGQILIAQGQLADAEKALRKACETGYTASCENELVRGVSSQPSAPPTVINPSATPATPSAAPTKTP